MLAPQMTKYVFQIRSCNGAIVDNLQIYGKTEEDSKRKLFQMYRNCEVLKASKVVSDRAVSASYEDVLNMIVNNA